MGEQIDAEIVVTIRKIVVARHLLEQRFVSPKMVEQIDAEMAGEAVGKIRELIEAMKPQEAKLQHVEKAAAAVEDIFEAIQKKAIQKMGEQMRQEDQLSTAQLAYSRQQKLQHFETVEDAKKKEKKKSEQLSIIRRVAENREVMAWRCLLKLLTVKNG
jgi:hypothetical protein